MNKRGLGKGLGALLLSDNDDKGSVKEIRISDIEPNVQQPRKKFDDAKLEELSESIKIHGVVQPIIVKKEDEIYRIIAGERRWRAARMAGLTSIPALVKDFSSREELEVALIENIQREDLNPIEEAETFERLLKEHDLTQEELSKSVGRSRSAIANTIRLMGLSEVVKQYLINLDISSGHARALLSIESKSQQEKVAEEIINRKLNVRDTEMLVSNILLDKGKRKKKGDNVENLVLEEKLQKIFKTKVKLIANKKRGKIMIEYYSNDELERILDIMNGLERSHFQE